MQCLLEIMDDFPFRIEGRRGKHAVSSCLAQKQSRVFFFFFNAFAGNMIGAAQEIKCSCILQFLLAATEFSRHGSADRPHTSSCRFVKGATL